MREKELRDLEELELFRAKQIAATLWNKKKQGVIFSERELYPELNLESPYSYCIGAIKAKEILPFFSTLIVDLRPLPNAAEFESRYGLSVEEFTRFVDQGRIVIRVRGSYLHFKGLDYLDQLLTRQPTPPTSIRYKYLHGSDHEEYFERGKALHPKQRPRANHWQMEYADWAHPPRFREVFANKFALVSCYFGPDYAQEIVERAFHDSRDIGIAYDWLHVFSRLRVYPFMNCLDGINTLSLSDLAILPTYLQGVKQTAEKPKSQSLPYEVGRALLSNLSFDKPEDFNRAFEIAPQDWQKAIADLDKALEKDRPENITDKCNKLTRLAQETRKEVKKMLRRKHKIEMTFVTIGGLGIVGTLSHYAPHEWQPIMGIASGAMMAVRTMIADAAVKFRKKSHVVTWFKLERKLKPSSLKKGGAD